MTHKVTPTYVNFVVILVIMAQLTLKKNNIHATQAITIVIVEYAFSKRSYLDL